MKIRIWPRSRWARAGLLLLVVALVPYTASRIASPWRCVSVHLGTDAPPELDPSAASAPASHLRIACYNIAHGRGVAESNWKRGDRVERKDRLDQIAELLKEVNADIVVLNEVDFDSSWSHSTNQAKYLAEQAGYPYWVEERNLDFRILGWTWRFGNAILSKHPVANANVVQLPEFEGWETYLAGKKRAVRCDVDVQGQSLRVIAAHLSHRSESVRVRSAKMISQLVADSPLPTIVAGDMNSTPSGFPNSANDENGENAMDAFDEAGDLQRSPQNPPTDDARLTFHSTEPRSIIDWILVPDAWAYADYVVHTSTLSDHRLIYADLKIGSGPADAP